MLLTHEEYLAHYGVKGMKWGVRRAERRAYSASKRKFKTRDPRKLSEKEQLDFMDDYERRLANRKNKTSRKAQEQAKRSSERRQVDSIRENKKKARYMTDAELKTAINRLNLETQYNRLSLEVYSPGKKFARDFIMRSGNKAADAVVQQYAIKRIRGS